MESPSITRVRSPLINHARSPLSTSTNSPPPNAIPASSTSDHTASQRQQIRHKGSLSYHKKDSSEEFPSSNGSIYNAHSYSKSNSAESKPENSSQIAGTIIPSQEDVDVDVDVDAELDANWESWEYQMLSLDNAIGVTPFIYGQGTRLDTIIEKNSNSTMQTLTHSKSTGAISTRTSSVSILGIEDGFKVPRIQRQRSLSLDDLSSIQRSYHEACASVAGVKPNRSQLHIHNIYAQPKKPLHAPPERPSTPPGMPSWNAMQRRPIPPRGSSVTRDRIRNWWSGQPPMPSRIPTPTESGSRIRLPPGMTPVPRFRPPRSAYGSLDSHPFNRIASAKVPKSSPSESSGITVTRTWTIDHRPALPVQEQPPRSQTSMSDQPRVVRFMPSAVGGSEASASTLSYIHNIDRMNTRCTSNANCSSTSISPKNRPCHHRHHSLPSLTSRHRNVNENNTTNTGIFSGTLRNRYDTIPSPAIPASVLMDGHSSIGNSNSPAISQTYIVPVTNIETEAEKKKRHADLCYRCYVHGCLTELGTWIDRTGEKIEGWAEEVGKGVCLMCCGYTGDEEFVGASSSGGMRGGGGGGSAEIMRPRQIFLGVVAGGQML